MTDLETSLARALKLLSQSAWWYIEEGKYIDLLNEDLINAENVLNVYKKMKKEEI